VADIRTESGRELAESSLEIHWSAVLGGSFVAIGVWLFLLSVGAALQGSGGPNAWTAIYQLISPIVALFVGGMVAARSRLSDKRFDGILHGAVIWGFTMSVGILVLSTVLAVVRIGATQAGRLPTGFGWAIVGAMLGSLIASLLGTSSAMREREMLRRGIPREVHP
jgi:peptidoglycan/LPS O-acetylase OafA/YrhL